MLLATSTPELLRLSSGRIPYRQSVELMCAKLDERILKNCLLRWQKVAMVVAKTSKEDEQFSFDKIAERIKMLVESGQLKSVGDLGNWRGSEIRLPNS
jgi:hypothetical protein